VVSLLGAPAFAVGQRHDGADDSIDLTAEADTDAQVDAGATPPSTPATPTPASSPTP
jgi:hypothetical protein